MIISERTAVRRRRPIADQLLPTAGTGARATVEKTAGRRTGCDLDRPLEPVEGLVNRAVAGMAGTRPIRSFNFHERSRCRFAADAAKDDHCYNFRSWLAASEAPAKPVRFRPGIARGDNRSLIPGDDDRAVRLLGRGLFATKEHQALPA